MEKYCEDGYNFTVAVKAYYEKELGYAPPLIAFAYSLGAVVAAAISNLSRERLGADIFTALLLQAPGFKFPAYLANFVAEMALLVSTDPGNQFKYPPEVERKEDYSFLWEPNQDVGFYPGPYTANTYH